MSRFFVLLLQGVLLCIVVPASAQDQSADAVVLSGYVRDASTGETLLLANVVLRSPTNPDFFRGATTNNDGFYTMTGIPPGSYTLVVSYLGFQTGEIPLGLAAGETRRLDVDLEPAGLAIEELVVTGEREEAEDRSIGVTKLQTSLIKQLPSVLEPDLFRSLQLLPGVKATSDFSSGLYIRGGSPDQTLILLDQTTVYNPTHFFGLYSTFNPDAIKDVRLYKGGYPAQYGGRLGSVVDIYNKDGNRYETAGGVSVGLLASRAFVEGPYGRGRDGEAKGSYMVAARRSTLEPLLSVLRSTDTDGIPDGFYFYDINAKFGYDPGPSDKLSLAVYGGRDLLDLEFLDDARFDIQYGNQTISADWTHLLSDRVFTNLTVTGSRYASTPVAMIAGTRFTQENRVADVSLKADVEYTPTARHALQGGLWVGSLAFTLVDTFDGDENFRQRIQSEYASVYFQDTYSPTPDWQFRAGLRANYFDRGAYWRLEPRLSVDYTWSPAVRLQAAFGRYYQFLTLETSELFTGFDSWLMTDEGVAPSYGDQVVLGLKTTPWGTWRIDLEGYARTMRDLFEQDPFLPDLAGVPYAETFRFGSGRAYGAEVLLQRTEGRLNGFLGYTLGRTERRFPEVNLTTDGRPQYYTPKYDRTHDLNLVLNYQWSPKWKATSVFKYGTGQAYTEPTFRYSLVDEPLNTDADVLVSPFNGARLPAYHRLDLGVARTGRFFDIADLELQLQVINVYSRRNVWFYFFEFQPDGTVERNEVPQIPVPLPNLSLTLRF